NNSLTNSPPTKCSCRPGQEQSRIKSRPKHQMVRMHHLPCNCLWHSSHNLHTVSVEQQGLATCSSVPWLRTHGSLRRTLPEKQMDSENQSRHESCLPPKTHTSYEGTILAVPASFLVGCNQRSILVKDIVVKALMPQEHIRKEISVVMD